MSNAKFLCICPNPAIDVTLFLKNFQIGELNRAEAPDVSFAGKAINVGKAIKSFGGEVCISGFMFENDSVEYERQLNDLGIITDFVVQAGSVRKNYKIVNEKAGLTEINTSAETVTERSKIDLVQKLKESSRQFDVCVISGSLPKGCRETYYGELAEACCQTNLIIDTEGNQLLEGLVYKPYLIKPNRVELEAIVGHKIKTTQEMKDAITLLIEKGAKNVLVSLGMNGAILSDGAKYFYAESPVVEVKSSVGAGDCMIGSYAYHRMQGYSMQQLLACSVAAGSAAVMTEGTQTFRMADYQRLVNQIKIQVL